MGFWEQFFDYFTDIDNVLKEIKAEYIEGNRKLIEAITGLEPEEPEIPHRHTPFYTEGSIAANDSDTLLIKDDAEQGLGAVGRSGVVRNDSTTNSLYVVIDDGTGQSNEITVLLGEVLTIDRDDDVWVNKLTLSSKAGTIPYRCLFSR